MKQGQGINFRNASVNQSSWKSKPQSSDTSQQSGKGNDKLGGQKQNNTFVIPYKLSKGEYTANKRTRTCNTCDEWSKNHNFRNRELNVMVVLNGDEMEYGVS